jgi:hypothetical protein
MHSDLLTRLRAELERATPASPWMYPLPIDPKLLREAIETLERFATQRDAELQQLWGALEAIKEAAKAPDYKWASLDRDIDAALLIGRQP